MLTINETYVRKKLFDALVMLKMIRQSSPSIFRELLASQVFEKDVLKPLKEIENLTQARKIKNVNQFLKEIHSAEHVDYHEKVISEEFDEKVIKPLEKLAGWRIENEKKPAKFAKMLNQQTHGKTLKEKREKMSGFTKIAIVAGAIFTIATGSVAAYKIYKNKAKDEGEAEK